MYTKRLNKGGNSCFADIHKCSMLVTHAYLLQTLTSLKANLRPFICIGLSLLVPALSYHVFYLGFFV
jgi:hypothetical protein